ncbi:hypothetical protein RBB50_001126 [Rhinocladiella similis]
MPSNESVKRNLKLIQHEASKVLGLTVGKHTPKPGDYIPKADAQTAPSISYAGLDSSKSYMVVCLDIDAPFRSFDILGPILHWIQPGFTVIHGSAELSSTAPFVVNYIGPAPPPGAAPHRYCFFLYEQPSGFDGKQYAPPNGQKLSNWSRMRYSLDAWEKKTGLGTAVAVNYFTSN